MRIAALFLIKVCGYMPRVREQQAVNPTTPASSYRPAPQYLPTIMLLWSAETEVRVKQTPESEWGLNTL